MLVRCHISVWGLGYGIVRCLGLANGTVPVLMPAPCVGGCFGNLIRKLGCSEIKFPLAGQRYADGKGLVD